MGKIVLLVLASIFVCQICIAIDAEITFVDSNCKSTDFNYTHGSVYENNLNLLFTNLTPKSSSQKFYNSTVGVGPNKAYGLYQCRNDVSLDVCSECVKGGTHKIFQKCPLSGEAIVWYYECMLRFSNRNIFSLPEISPFVTQLSTDNVTNYAEFAPILNEVIRKASSTLQHFASREANLSMFQQLYSFAQCTPIISDTGCNSCLRSALTEIGHCCNKSIYAMVFMPSCQLRYDMSPFLADLSNPPSPNDKGAEKSKNASLKLAIIGAIAACGSVALLVLSVFLWRRRKRPKEEAIISRVPPGSPRGLHYGSFRGYAETFGDTEFVQYDFFTLKIATRDFSAENKLGEGGFGIVYKGTHEDGDQLAIKRLSETSGQGNKEFMTEARLLAKLQHRNLVKLVGFCSEGEEKLLVYEFMPNGSLDGFLFDRRQRYLLDWIVRCKIIMGIAKGLQYLHEDSRLTIIHRDLKPDNILLDNEMNPKIADFGLAKLFDGAQKLGNTFRIVGTQGYMAPEYMRSGEYSDKTDVYSFGIMLLEIVSGQKNKIFNQSSEKEDLSTHAWKLWNEGRSFELTDPVLINNCSSNEVKRCIQIGLLCVQSNAKQRPTMALVIFMLTGSVDLPLPLAPIAMPSLQSSTSVSYSGGQQSDVEQSSTKSATIRATETQDLYPKAG